MTLPYLKFAKMKKIKETIISFELFCTEQKLIHSYEPKFGSIEPSQESYARYVDYTTQMNECSFQIQKFAVCDEESIRNAEETDGFISWIG